MTDDERQRAIDFVVAQEAKNSVQLEKLIDAHRTVENRLSLTARRMDRTNIDWTDTSG